MVINVSVLTMSAKKVAMVINIGKINGELRRWSIEVAELPTVTLSSWSALRVAGGHYVTTPFL